ncbi:MAG TPA: hypothetical protein VGQ33_21230 [Vicinamibacteria bacterium]|nr:hypothetical protein [Vicinamibacteria bacterium]
MPWTLKTQMAMAVGVATAALNLVAYRQARGFTHFAPPGHQTWPKRMSPAEKLGVLVAGWDGSTQRFPGFPADGTWTIRAEGWQPLP